MTTPAFDPGSVRLRLRLVEGRARDVAVACARPNVAALLRGRSADEAVRLLPLLYSICGTAQGCAARLALRAARGEAVAPAVDAAALAEARGEHLWRLLLDWPQALGLPDEKLLLAQARRRLQQDGAIDMGALRAPFERLEKTLAMLGAPAAVVPLLPPLDAAQTLALWPRLTAGFAAAPIYRGAPAETGALARRADIGGANAILARVRARIADLESPQGLGVASAAPVAPGVGRAAVETARGLLLHEISLDGDVVAGYVIVAPTEWNFHAAGPLHAWLEGAAAASPQALRELAGRALLALDPCVRAEIEVIG